jgi:hypothetical protein
VNWSDNYGTRIRGYLTPPVDGSYTFWIASDANSELWLSSDADPCHISKIAFVSGSTNSRQWDKYPSQQSAEISLTSNQKYYIEVLHKAGAGNDNIAVAWQGPGLNQKVIDGLYMSPFNIGLRDLAGFAGNWRRSDCSAANDWCDSYDFKQDGSVLFDDLHALVTSWLVGSR